MKWNYCKAFKRSQNTSKHSLNRDRIKCDQAISTCLSLSSDENCSHVCYHDINPDLCGGENELNHIFNRCDSLVQLLLLSLRKVPQLRRALWTFPGLPGTCDDFRSVRLTSRIRRTFERLVLKQLWPGPTAGTQVWKMPSFAFSTCAASTWLCLALLSGLIFDFCRAVNTFLPQQLQNKLKAMQVDPHSLLQHTELVMS